MASASAIARQVDRQNAAGLGAFRIRVALTAPPPTDQGWVSQPVPPANTISGRAFAQAMSSAPGERMVQGRRGPMLWRSWRYGTVWYATSRPNTRTPPVLFHFSPVPSVTSSMAGAPAGTGALVVTPPVLPAPNDPRWRNLSSSEVGRLARTGGWALALAVATTHADPAFRFERSWYRLVGRQLQTLGPGSTPHGGTYGNRAVAGAPGVGQTNPNFAPPTTAQVQNNPPGEPLADAATAMLADFATNGIPSEHTSRASVVTFQSAWNADGISSLNAPNGILSVDGGYGQNTHDALASIGVTAPPVNTGPAPAPSPVTPPAPGPSPTPPSPTPGNVQPGGLAIPLIVGAAVLGTGIVSYALLKRSKRLRSAHHTTTHHRHAPA